MNQYKRIYAVDFDGTLCQDKFPEIGEPKEDIIQIIKEYKSFGWKIILWTCRNKEHLTKAVEWCKERGLEFDAVNDNLPVGAFCHLHNVEHVHRKHKAVQRMVLPLLGKHVQSEI